MSLTNYSDLQTAILDWMGRPGDATALAGRVQDAITVFESKVRRNLRHPQMVNQQILAIDAEYVDLPTDYLEMKDMFLQYDPTQPLRQVSLEALRFLFNESETNIPTHFAISGNQIVFGPAPDDVYSAQMTYYAFTGLSNIAPTNWLMTKYPDLYLFGALIEAHSFAADPDAVVGWRSRYTEAYTELDDAGRRAEQSPAMQAVPDLAWCP